MTDLIKTDMFKMFKSSLIKILFCISAVGAGLMLLFAHLVATGDTDIQNTGIASLFADSQIFILLGCVIIGMFFCNDFEYKIIENAVSSGHSRSSVVISKVVSLIILITVLTIPYIVILLVTMAANMEISVYMQTAYLNIIGLAASGTSAGNIIMLIITTILSYSAQVSIGIFIMILVRKPVIVVALSYVILLLLGPVLGLNETTKDLLTYTPYGIDYSHLVSNIDIFNFIKSIIISIVFIIIVIGISILTFKKTEIK